VTIASTKKHSHHSNAEPRHVRGITLIANSPLRSLTTESSTVVLFLNMGAGRICTACQNGLGRTSTGINHPNQRRSPLYTALAIRWAPLFPMNNLKSKEVTVPLTRNSDSIRSFHCRLVYSQSKQTWQRPHLITSPFLDYHCHCDLLGGPDNANLFSFAIFRHCCEQTTKFLIRLICSAVLHTVIISR